MDQLLAPWFARADALLPEWRTSLHTGDAIVLTTESVAAAAPQRRLHETLAVLAAARHVAPAQFHALTRPRNGTAAKAPPSAALPEALPFSLRVQVDFRANVNESTAAWKALLGDRDNEIASDDFKATRAALGRCPAGRAQWESEVELRFLRAHTGGAPLDAGRAVALLQGIDHHTFRVTTLRIVVATPDLEPTSVVALTNAVEKYRETADVTIHLQLAQPRDQDLRLIQWKRVFDATLRQQREVSTNGKCWDVVVAMDGAGLDHSGLTLGDSETNTYTDVRVVTACLSALAYVGDYVTSIELLHPLADVADADLYKPTDRRVRAKWLGYLLRIGPVERLTIRETKFTQDDMDMMASTLHAASEQQCLRALWHDAWYSDVVSDPARIEDKVPVLDDDVQQLLNDPRDIVGVMQNDRLDDATSLVDVFIIGYGQCTMPRSALPLSPVMHNVLTRLVPTDRRGLKSLTVRLTRGEGTEGHLLRLVMALGKPLMELVLDADHSQIALSVLIIILASCPRLKRLTIKTLYLSLGDDEQLFLPTHWANHTLEDLRLDLHMNEAAVGLGGLASVLVLFGVQLKTLCVHAAPLLETNETAKSAIQKMLRTCCTSLQTLEVVGLGLAYFSDVMTPDAIGLDQLTTFAVSVAESDRSTWHSLMMALSEPTHPLTRSLHTLRVETPLNLTESTASMLEANAILVECDLAGPRRMSPPSTDALFATHGRSLRRRQGPLSIRQKAAFLSGIDGSAVPWESSVLGTIFLFAAPTETRRVVRHW